MLLLAVGASEALGQRTARSQTAVPVEIMEQSDGGFQLLRGGEPYYVKGAKGAGPHLDRLARYGGNSVRTSDPEMLDRAHERGLTVQFHLPVAAQRDGMDYSDPEAVREQKEEVLAMVRKYKDHPAVLFWELGNELDHVPDTGDPDAGETTVNWKVYDAVNELAKAIHEEDPNHPVLTVLGTGTPEKLGRLQRRAPALDLIGVNAYADIGQVEAWLEEYGWERPYVFTEWGPSGFWQVPQTDWGRAVEETSTTKAHLYRERYRSSIRGPEQCVGSYVFLWQQHQERTHTWFGMFDAEGRASEAVGVMQHAWTGEWPDNRAPHLNTLIAGGRTAYGDLPASAFATDRDGDALRYDWEVLPENTNFGYGGQGETKPPPVSDAVPADANQRRIAFTAPSEPGAYRLFAYVYDGNGHYATANVPFLVEEPDPAGR
ncbi:MAG: hypothetical protein BRD37_01015 [Bacteroidetes bacterium QH_8_67_23]|nr:MAG: hypothetical protein BRD37_01015 [Bacteroidetes bacterium QH_8_67_23]